MSALFARGQARDLQRATIVLVKGYLYLKRTGTSSGGSTRLVQVHTMQVGTSTGTSVGSRESVSSLRSLKNKFRYLYLHLYRYLYKYKYKYQVGKYSRATYEENWTCSTCTSNLCSDDGDDNGGFRKRFLDNQPEY